mgnify:CR=1 FL=1|tara:strand:- start:100 stop:564 length:465 start_codon:yes stop_codon:yes gene_type:complete
MNNILLENYIKSIIEENQINELHVFDFDMTLYDHNKENWISKTVRQLKESLQSPQTRVILCTARTNKSKYILETEKLLNKNNMSLKDFDECYFKSAHRKEKTPVYKSNVILDEVSANYSIKKVMFWDDRSDSLNQVKDDLKSFDNRIQYTAIKC